MNDRDQSAAFLGASIDPNIPIIDLHLSGNLENALNQLERELDRLSRSKSRYCRIVHGIGSGILASAVHKVLAENSLVLDWQEDENGGSCVVLF